MASMTAQLIIGNPHPNRGGIWPINTIALNEGSRPAWVMNTGKPGRIRTFEQIVWIPTVEHMLEDALLMAAVHAFKSDVVRDKFSSFSDKIDEQRLELYTDLSSDQRQELYVLCRNLVDYPKVIVHVYEGSWVKPYINAIDKYQMECEVCCSIYSRIYSPWTQKGHINASLPPCVQ